MSQQTEHQRASTEIGTVQAGKSSAIVVNKTTNENGEVFIDVRVKAFNKETQAWCMTKKGLFMSPDVFNQVRTILNGIEV